MAEAAKIFLLLFPVHQSYFHAAMYGKLKKHLQKTLPKSAIGMAIAYTLNLWPRLIRYIQDGRFKIDNNLIENAIRPLVIGRKNYLFAGSHEAAQRAVQELNGKDLDGRTVVVNEARPMVPRENRGSDFHGGGGGGFHRSGGGGGRDFHGGSGGRDNRGGDRGGRNW